MITIPIKEALIGNVEGCTDDHVLYIIREDTTVFYVGHSVDPLTRLEQHYPVDCIGELIWTFLKTYSYIGTFRRHMPRRRIGGTWFTNHVSVEYSCSGRRWTCLSVDQVKALPYIITFPLQKFLLGEQPDLLPRSCFTKPFEFIGLEFPGSARQARGRPVRLASVNNALAVCSISGPIDARSGVLNVQKAARLMRCLDMLRKSESLPKAHCKTSLPHQCEAPSGVKALPRYGSTKLPTWG
jgi:hypothetical protein